MAKQGIKSRCALIYMYSGEFMYSSAREFVHKTASNVSTTGPGKKYKAEMFWGEARMQMVEKRNGKLAVSLLPVKAGRDE